MKCNKCGKEYMLLAWQYSYFNEGLSLTQPVKYLLYAYLAFAGLQGELANGLIAGLGYSVIAYLLGWIAYKSGFMKARQEVSNLNNKFVEEVRQGFFYDMPVRGKLK